VTVATVADRDGNECLSNKTKYGLCPSDRYFGMTTAARAARHQAAVVAARREAARRKRAASRARARAALIVAENAWHKGYDNQDGNVYWKWVNGACRAEGEAELERTLAFYRSVGATFFIQRGEQLLAKSA
jgi:hypothetical protein